MTAEHRLQLLDDLLARARKAGADSADAIFVDGTSVSIAVRLGEIEHLERSEGADLGLRVFKGKRQACVSSSDVTPEALDDLVERAVAMAETVPEDQFCGLADAERIGSDYEEIDLDDPGEPSTEILEARARAAEDAARAVTGVTNSEGAEASFGRSRVALAASNGFRGERAGTRSSISASVLAGEGTAMERDYEYSSTVFAEDLDDPATVGRLAGEKAVARLNPQKISSASVPVVYDPRVAGSLLGHLAGAINGSAIARGTSFLKDKMGESVFPAGVVVTDDPLRPRGLRSKPFDAEGLATAKRNVIEDGRLTTWILDLHAARELGLESTGHAARGTSSPPSPSVTNLYLEPGKISRAELIGAIDKGLLVTELIGMGVNGVTGDYSRGASGFWIENGEIAYPVSEITIAGNLIDMFANLTAADDLKFKYGTDSPSVRIDGMTVAGK
ncbi:MAG: TldD/PmbA family protein [Rhodospirillales bacterium]